MPPTRSAANTQGKQVHTFNLFLSCAQCIAPYLRLPDLLVLIKTSKLCNSTFTNTQLWLPICHRNNIKIESSHINNPYSQLRVCSPGLNVAAHWRFNEWESHNSNILIDHSGNKDHLTIIKNPPGHNFPKTVFENAIFAHSSKKETLNGRKEFTAEVIVKPQQMDSGREYKFPILSKHNGANGWEIRCNNDVVSFMCTPHPWFRHEEIIFNKKAEGKEQENDGWSHIAATFDGKQACLYVNGKLSAQKAFSYEISKFEECKVPFTIGYCAGGIKWKDRISFRGEIREVRICYKTLLPEQFLKI